MKQEKDQSKVKDLTEEDKIESCRMYENEYPNVNDLVMCKITEIFDDGAYVELLEYNNIKGMILKSEITRKRKQNVKQITREGKDEVLKVIRIDTAQGYIDLSKKDVKTDEIDAFQEYYGKSKQVHNIMKSIAMKIKVKKLEELYKLFGWELYREYKHAYEGFKLILE
jgi:translation initiation factor 2 subunit 1